ncbi:MAG: alpha/beta hydrolase [SAR324 cluster bacterium]|nr:alpha/beta hydrolase [SAR324 cluster bacterium]
MPYLTLQRRRIYYDWREGFKPGRDTLIFLHDGLGASGSWKDIPRTLGHMLGANALVYDRWGYGRSEPRGSFPFGFMEGEVPALLELLDGLDLPRVHLVGHSDGGSIALLFAAQYPERLSSLVTEAAHVFVEPRTRAGIQALVDAQAAGRTPSWLKNLHGARADAVLRAWSKGWLSARHKQWNIEQGLGAIQLPTLVIQGMQDEFGSKAQVAAIVDRVAGCRSWLVKSCGHTPHTQAASRFTERVGKFLARHINTGP